MVYGVGIGAINHIAKDKPEKFRSAFKVLLDDSKDLQERIIYFNEKTLQIYRELVPDEKLSHHQDERTMATYLAYFDANKYPFYMDSFYKKYCSLVGVKPKQKNYKYVHYLTLLKELIQDYILPDDELLEIKSELLDKECFEDKNHLILAQDILFQMLEKKSRF